MSKKAPASAKSAATQADILSYRHPDRRKNNPEVGMVTLILECPTVSG